MVPIEEPMLPEDVQDFKHRGAILLNPFQGRADVTGGRRGRRSQFHLLVRKGEDRGESCRDNIEMMGVRKQEAACFRVIG